MTFGDRRFAELAQCVMGTRAVAWGRRCDQRRTLYQNSHAASELLFALFHSLGTLAATSLLSEMGSTNCTKCTGLDCQTVSGTVRTTTTREVTGNFFATRFTTHGLFKVVVATFCTLDHVVTLERESGALGNQFRFLHADSTFNKEIL